MATRYWVGGTGNWDTSSTKWATTDGGASTQTFATGDTVFITSKNAPNWTSLAALSSGAIRSPTTGNGYYYEVTTSGTTGATEPTWPTPAGTTVTDGTVVWTCRLATITLSANVSALTLTMTGFAGTLAFGTNTISVSGTGTVFTGATTYSVSGTPLILVTNAAATARTISAGSATEANSISFNINNGGNTLTVSGSIRDLIFSGSFVGSFPNGTLTIYGNLTFKSGMTISSGGSARTFAATSGTQKITSATLNLDFPITLAGTGIVQLQDALSVGAATSRIITLTSGTLDLNGFTLTNFGVFSSANTNTRSIAFNGGNYKNTLTTTTTVVSMATTTGFTYTGTPTFNITGNTTGITTTVSFTGTETNSLNINVSSGVGTVALTGTFKNINLTGFTGTLSNTARTIYGNLIIPSGATLTAGANATTFAATSGTQQITSAGVNLDFPITFSGTITYQLQDDLAVGTSTSRTITHTSGTIDLQSYTLTHFGTYTSSSSVSNRGFTGTGVYNITRTGTATYWDCAVATGFTRSGSPSVQFTGVNTSASTLTVLHGTTAGGAEATAMSFFFGSAPIVVLANTNWIADLGVLPSSSISLSGGATPRTIYGGFFGGSTTTQSSNPFGALTFASTSATARNINIFSSYALTFNGVGGSWQLSGTSSAPTVTLTNGSFSTNGNSLGVATFDFTTTGTRTLNINTTLTISSSGIFKGISTGTTLNNTGTISGSGYTVDVPNLNIGNVITTGYISIGASASSYTINNLTAPSGGGGFVYIYAGSTLNIAGNLSIDGASGNTNTLQSSFPGTRATISKSSGTIITNNLNIVDSNATGGATWRAPTNYGNIDGGNNLGWNFSAISAGGGGNFLMFF
jgi:hypothetical protein